MPQITPINPLSHTPISHLFSLPSGQVVGMVKGTFEGIVEEDVSEPQIREIGAYDTVYYGTLSRFVLVVPADAEIEYHTYSDISNIIIVKHAGRKYCFKITYGDAMFPDKLTPIECP
jgi:hypothetical protein